MFSGSRASLVWTLAARLRMKSTPCRRYTVWSGGLIARKLAPNRASHHARPEARLKVAITERKETKVERSHRPTLAGDERARSRGDGSSVPRELPQRAACPPWPDVHRQGSDARELGCDVRWNP